MAGCQDLSSSGKRRFWAFCSHNGPFVSPPAGCWAASRTPRSSAPRASSPPTRSPSRGCWRTRPSPGAAWGTASVPRSSTAASSSSTCTRWPPTRSTGQRVTDGAKYLQQQNIWCLYGVERPAVIYNILHHKSKGPPASICTQSGHILNIGTRKRLAAAKSTASSFVTHEITYCFLFI